MCRRLTFLVSFVLVLGLAASMARADITEGLIGYWPFDEGSGTTATDVTGNGNNGALADGVEWVQGYLGGGVHLDTGGERIVIGPLDPTAENNAMTLAIWINWEGAGSSIEHQGIFGKRLGWDPGAGIKWFWETTPNGDLVFRADNAGGGDAFGWGNGLINSYPNEWIHVALTWDDGAGVQYINAEEVATGNVNFRDTADDTPMTIGCVGSGNTETFVGSMDEARIYNRALSAADIEELFAFKGGLPVKAAKPSPDDGAVDVYRNVIMSWKDGFFADTHDVYLGTVFEDVNDADRDNPLDVLLVQGHDANTYEPGRLEIGQMYYWRVDEVNAPPDETIFTGNIWSFTVEPVAYPIDGGNIIATASSSDVDKAPENSINGSGLDESGLLHGNISTGTMWLSSPDGNQPSWIEYEFDNVYKLHEMWVWNSNESLEPIIGIGMKEVTIEYSADGNDYTTLGTTHEFAQAPGTPDYAHDTTIDFEGVAAKFVKLTANSNWGNLLNQYSLSEVRFFYKPVHASDPVPASGAMDVTLEPTLGWRPGREAAEHNIYFSNDRQAVIDGTADMTTVTDDSYGPLDLDLGRTYYWRIDEVNNTETPSTWQGEVWDYTTFEYFVIEGFEDYDDYEPNRIFDTWVDGWNIPTNGSTVGYPDPVFAAGEHFVETAIVHSGSQSMPYFYDNTAAGNSEASMTLSNHRDWTKEGISSLALWFRGNAVGFMEDPAGTYTINASGVDIWGTADEFRFVYKQLSGDGSIIARVESVEDTDPWAKAGVMIRETLNPGSKFAGVYVTPGNGCRFQARLISSADATSDTDVATTEQIAITAPYWVKIERTGNNFNGYYSSDGINWVAISWNPQNNVMPNSVYIGLAVTSHNANETCTAVISGVETTGTVSPQTWTQQAIGADMPSNDAEQMYVVLNGSAVVYNDNPDASLIDEWTEWNIDLQKFADQGIDLTDVDTFGIGFGDRDNPQPGGEGLVFFDDIMVGNPLPPVGLVAHFELENNAEDSSGNGYHGTIAGDPVFVDGPAGLGMALEFDGTGDQYVDIGTFNPSKVTDKLSVSLWAKWNGLTDLYQGLIGKRDTWAADDMMWQIEANQTDGTLGFSSEGSYPSDGDPVLPIGEWAHVAITFDGTTAKFYFNGQLTGEGAFSFGSDPQAAVQFGACEADGGNPFNGALDDIRIYDIVLSDAEVLELAGQ